MPCIAASPCAYLLIWLGKAISFKYALGAAAIKTTFCLLFSPKRHGDIRDVAKLGKPVLKKKWLFNIIGNKIKKF